MGRRVLGMWAAVLLAAGCQPQQDATTRERERLRGTWALATMVMDGKEETDPVLKQTYRLTFEVDHYSIRVEGRTQGRGRYQIDAAASPMTMDIMPEDGPDAGKTFQGIYQEEHGVLTVCALDGERPTRFFGKDAPAGLLLVLKRESP